MGINKEQVESVAKLARLKLNEKQLEKYTADLSNIVDFANTLMEVDVSNVEPTAHILKIQNVFREDVINESYNRDELLKNAPTKEAGCISVPKTVE